MITSAASWTFAVCLHQKSRDTTRKLLLHEACHAMFREKRCVTPHRDLAKIGMESSSEDLYFFGLPVCFVASYRAKNTAIDT